MKNSRISDLCRGLIATVLIASALAPIRAEAQLSQPTLDVLRPLISKSVSVVRRDGHDVRGKLIDAAASELTLEVDGSRRTVTASDISTVAVRDSSWRRGATIGAGVGIIVAGVAIATTSKPENGLGKAAVAAIGVASYAALGALIGNAVHHYTIVFTNSDLSRPAPQ